MNLSISRLIASMLAAMIVVPAALAGGGNLTVTAVDPPARALTASRTASLSVTFDRPVDPSTVDELSFWAFGR
ncbi:MAG: hypothetical protein KDA25_10420, partial [Phycisphaerales bacterium]|nr:hypothetical protein [Phycisphaerales bacterium]